MHFANAIARSTLRGAEGTSLGIDHPWANVEPVVHDVAHAVTLGCIIGRPSALEHQIHWLLEELDESAKMLNEAHTLATELTFLREQGDAFEDNGEEWLEEVCRDAAINQKSVIKALEHPDLRLWVRRLNARLRYHANFYQL